MAKPTRTHVGNHISAPLQEAERRHPSAPAGKGGTA